MVGTVPAKNAERAFARKEGIKMNVLLMIGFAALASFLANYRFD